MGDESCERDHVPDCGAAKMTWREVYEGREVAQWVKDLAGRSGCYLVRDKGLLGSVLYVGESHTGRLKKTLLRHFQHWKGPTKGPTFRRGEVEVAVVRTKAESAVSTQNALISEYSPKLNVEGKKEFWA